jgi:hypothetical protein
LRSPLQNFRTTPSISFSFISGPYHFDYDFFYFRISYKVINAFQFYPILFFNLSNLS